MCTCTHEKNGVLHGKVTSGLTQHTLHYVEICPTFHDGDSKWERRVAITYIELCFPLPIQMLYFTLHCLGHPWGSSLCTCKHVELPLVPNKSWSDSGHVVSVPACLPSFEMNPVIWVKQKLLWSLKFVLTRKPSGSWNPSSSIAIPNSYYQ